MIIETLLSKRDQLPLELAIIEPEVLNRKLYP